MKKLIVAMLAVLLLSTGCTKEIEQSKSESKEVVHQVKKVNEEKSVVAYNPLTDDEKVYMETIGEMLGAYSKTTNSIRDLMREANSNPSVATTDEWINKLKGDFIGIATMHTIVEEMSDNDAVPERFSSINSDLSETFKLMVVAGDLLVKSIQNNLDPELFNKSMETMAKSNQELDAVNAKLDKVQTEVGVK